MAEEPAERPRAARPGELPADGPATVGGVALVGERHEALWRAGLPDDVAGAWGRLASQFPQTGLWPVLVQGERLEPMPGEDEVPDDAEALLRELWEEACEDDEELEEVVGDFPGLGRGGARQPAAVAARVEGVTALALVPVTRPADVLTAIGWAGAENAGNTAGVCTGILRSWEERYDAILVGLGFDTAHVAVRRPPPPEEALRAACEMCLLCPDLADTADDVVEVAETLPERALWSFWWD
jgi:hypothetical protein